MFRGQFKFKSANGSSLTYNLGDVVIDQGRAYECKKATTKSPIQDPISWSLTGMTEPYKGDSPPVSPVENQMWMSSSGILYMWFKDSNGFQWIQI
jgi:hypothetical protein